MKQPIIIKESDLYIYNYKLSAITNNSLEIIDYTGGGGF